MENVAVGVTRDQGGLTGDPPRATGGVPRRPTGLSNYPVENTRDRDGSSSQVVDSSAVTGVESHPDYCIFLVIPAEPPGGYPKGTMAELRSRDELSGFQVTQRILSAVGDVLYGRPDPGFFVEGGRRRSYPGMRFDRVFTHPTERISVSDVTIRRAGGVVYGIHVQFQGQAFESTSLGQLVELHDRLAECGRVECNRFDHAWDNVGFTVRMVRNAIKRGNIKTPAKAANRQLFETLMGESSGRDGQTVYVGSRESERVLRVYDRRGFVRLELENKGAQAQAFFLSLVQAYREGGEANAEQFARAMLASYVEIVDKSAASNLCRAPRLRWWASFMRGVVAIRPVVKRSVSTVVTKARFIGRSVPRTLAFVCDTIAALGGPSDFLGRLVERGRSLMHESDYAAIQEASLSGGRRALCASLLELVGVPDYGIECVGASSPDCGGASRVQAATA